MRLLRIVIKNLKQSLMKNKNTKKMKENIRMIKSEKYDLEKDELNEKGEKN